MIYIMSQKFYEKRKEKLAYFEYVCIDGENISVTGRESMDRQLSTKYSRFISQPSLTPETRLYEMCRRLKRGETVDRNRFMREIDFYFSDKSVIACLVKAMKLLLVKDGNPINIYMVLPNVQYVVMSKMICNFINKELLNSEFRVAYLQEEIKENSKILRSWMSEREYILLKDRIKKANKKWKIRYDNDDYEGDD